MIFVVLGMHKSGTSLLAQTLHRSGINMGDGFDIAGGYDDGNHYERQTVFDLNSQILARYSLPTLSEALRNYLGTNSQPYPSSLSIIRNLPLTLSLEERKQIRNIVLQGEREFSDWGFKDPRMSLTYRFWQEQLPSHKVLVIFRNYRELMVRYKVNGWRLTDLPRLTRVLYNWSNYNHNIITSLDESKADALYIQYEKFMSDQEEIHRIEEFVGKTLVDCRDTSKYRNRTNNNALAKKSAMYKAITRLLPHNPETVLRQLSSKVST